MAFKEVLIGLCDVTFPNLQEAIHYLYIVQYGFTRPHWVKCKANKIPRMSGDLE